MEKGKLWCKLVQFLKRRKLPKRWCQLPQPVLQKNLLDLYFLRVWPQHWSWGTLQLFPPVLPNLVEYCLLNLGCRYRQNLVLFSHLVHKRFSWNTTILQHPHLLLTQLIIGLNSLEWAWAETREEETIEPWIC